MKSRASCMLVMSGTSELSPWPAYKLLTALHKPPLTSSHVLCLHYCLHIQPLHLLFPWAWCALSCCHLVSMSHFRFLCSDARWRFPPWVAVEISISLLLYFHFVCGSCSIWLKGGSYYLQVSVGWVENIWEEIVSVLNMCGLFFFLSSVPISCSKTTVCWLVLPTCHNLDSPKKRTSIGELARSGLPMHSPWGIVC